MRFIPVFMLALALVGCAVQLAECRPSVKAKVKVPCEFSVDNPTACVGTLWAFVKCPTE